MYFTYQMSQTRLNLQVTFMMEERKKNQSEELDSLTLQENSQETCENGSSLPVSVKKNIYISDFCCVISRSHWVILHRQQCPKVCPCSPSPLCYQRLSLLYCIRRCPQASSPTPSPAEIQQNKLPRTWNNCRQN